MTAADDFEAVLTRIEEVLTRGKGSKRTLAEDDWFDKGFAPGMDPGEAARLAASHGRNKGLWVSIDSAEPAGLPDATSDLRAVQLGVVINVFYSAGSALRKENWRTKIAEAVLDMHKAAAALEQEGNLEQTEAGDPTGLASGAMEWTNWTFEEIDPENELLFVTMEFSAFVDINQPS